MSSPQCFIYDPKSHEESVMEDSSKTKPNEKTNAPTAGSSSSNNAATNKPQNTSRDSKDANRPGQSGRNEKSDNRRDDGKNTSSARDGKVTSSSSSARKDDGKKTSSSSTITGSRSDTRSDERKNPSSSSTRDSGRRDDGKSKPSSSSNERRSDPKKDDVKNSTSSARDGGRNDANRKDDGKGTASSSTRRDSHPARNTSGKSGDTSKKDDVIVLSDFSDDSNDGDRRRRRPGDRRNSRSKSRDTKRQKVTDAKGPRVVDHRHRSRSREKNSKRRTRSKSRSRKRSRSRSHGPRVIDQRFGKQFNRKSRSKSRERQKSRSRSKDSRTKDSRTKDSRTKDSRRERSLSFESRRRKYIQEENDLRKRIESLKNEIRTEKMDLVDRSQRLADVGREWHDRDRNLDGKYPAPPFRMRSISPPDRPVTYGRPLSPPPQIGPYGFHPSSPKPPYRRPPEAELPPVYYKQPSPIPAVARRKSGSLGRGGHHSVERKRSKSPVRKGRSRPKTPSPPPPKKKPRARDASLDLEWPTSPHQPSTGAGQPGNLSPASQSFAERANRARERQFAVAQARNFYAGCVENSVNDEALRSPMHAERRSQREMTRSRKMNGLAGADWAQRSLDNFEIMLKLGKGTYGDVYKALDTQGNMIVALRSVATDGSGDGFAMAALREIKILGQLVHPNIIHLLEIVRDRNDSVNYNSPNGKYFLSFDYAAHDVGGLLRASDVHLSSVHVAWIMKQLLVAVSYCHQRSVVHCDIRPSNILVTAKGDVKLSNFGLARAGESGASNVESKSPHSLWYRAPELLLGSEKYDSGVDMWSCGCVLGEMLRRKPLFPTADELQQLMAISVVCGSPSATIWPDVITLPRYYTVKTRPQYQRRLRSEFYENNPPIPDRALDLLDGLLTLDPRRRTTAVTALDSVWLKDLNNSCQLGPVLPMSRDCHSVVDGQNPPSNIGSMRMEQQQHQQQQQPQQQQRYLQPAVETKPPVAEPAPPQSAPVSNTSDVAGRLAVNPATLDVISKALDALLAAKKAAGSSLPLANAGSQPGPAGSAQHVASPVVPASEFPKAEIPAANPVAETPQVSMLPTKKTPFIKVIDHQHKPILEDAVASGVRMLRERATEAPVRPAAEASRDYGQMADRRVVTEPVGGLVDRDYRDRRMPLPSEQTINPRSLESQQQRGGLFEATTKSGQHWNEAQSSYATDYESRLSGYGRWTGDDKNAVGARGTGTDVRSISAAAAAAATSGGDVRIFSDRRRVEEERPGATSMTSSQGVSWAAPHSRRDTAAGDSAAMMMAGRSDETRARDAADLRRYLEAVKSRNLPPSAAQQGIPPEVPDDRYLPYGYRAGVPGQRPMDYGDPQTGGYRNPSAGRPM